MPLRPRQQKLFAALRALERAGDRLRRTEFVTHLVRETGYKEITTYLSKYLEPVVVKSADDTLGVRGVLAMSEDEFAALLTQKRLAAETHVARYEDRDEWADVVRSLLEFGAKHAYVLDEEDADLVAKVLPVGLVKTDASDV
jgi:hypothetical protein